jgi:hypothetical protein
MHLSNGFAAPSLLLTIGSPVTMGYRGRRTLISYGQAPGTATSRTVELIRLKGTKE